MPCQPKHFGRQCISPKYKQKRCYLKMEGPYPMKYMKTRDR